VLNVPWVVGSGVGAYPYLEGWTGLIFATSGCSCAVLCCVLFASDVRIWYMFMDTQMLPTKIFQIPINQSIKYPFHSIPFSTRKHLT